METIDIAGGKFTLKFIGRANDRRLDTLRRQWDLARSRGDQVAMITLALAIFNYIMANR